MSIWEAEQFMTIYMITPLCHACDLKIEGLPNQPTLETVRNFSFQAIVPFFGVGAGAAYPFQNACNYDVPWLLNFTTPESATPQFATVSQMWTLQQHIHNLPSYTALAGGPLYNHNYTTAADPSSSTAVGGQGYWMELIGALAWGVDAGVTGADAAYALCSGYKGLYPAASNYAPNAAPTSSSNNSTSTPQFSFVPRT